MPPWKRPESVPNSDRMMFSLSPWSLVAVTTTVSWVPLSTFKSLSARTTPAVASDLKKGLTQEMSASEVGPPPWETTMA